MSHTETEVLFAFGLDTEPPREIRLFGAGLTDTSKGQFLFDEDAADSVLSAFSDSGLDRLPFDYAHGMLKPMALPESHKAAGWFVPEVREVGGGVELWAADIQWTDAAHAAISAREFRFYSPAFDFEVDSRRVKRLTNVALTNIPATKNQRPLVLDSESDGTETGGDEPAKGKKMQVLLDALGCADEASAVARAIELSAAVKDSETKVASLTDDLIKANAEIAALSAAREADLKSAKIEALCIGGKLPPAQVEFAKGLTIAQLDSFAATLSSVVAQPVNEPATVQKTGELSDVEREVAKLIGVDEKTFLLGKVK